MKTYGLLGRKLSHSFSSKYFSEKFKKENISGCEYKNFELSEVSEIRDLVKSEPQLVGLNVTVPYKESIIPYLDGLEKHAEEIGAVNTILFENGKLIGANTDAIGFHRSLAAVFKPHHERALILGTGGASKAVAYTLRQLGVDFVFVSRTPTSGLLAYEELNQYVIKHYPLIINTTPLGTYPDVHACPNIPYEFLSSQNLLYDLVYNPEVTTFLSRGEKAGSATMNGLRMLILQAEKSWELWNRS